MRITLTLFLFVITIFANEKILLINSNKNIDKYNSVQESFINNFKTPFTTLDISNMSNKEIKKYLYNEYPDIIYTIGKKAYTYTNIYLPEKTIFFSSIVNYQRLNIKKNRYGVSNELHSGMNLTLIKSLFNKTKKLSLIYSEYTKDLYEEFKENGSKMGIEIVGVKISKQDSINIDNIKNHDGLILIADPILIKDEKKVLKLFDDMQKIKKPIFAYHELFLKFGASLVVSADNPTIGRQISSMIEQYINNEKIKPVQRPMGTNVILNKKVLKSLNIEYNKDASAVVTKVIQ